MPAVEISRLKRQLHDLSKVFDRPALFREGLNNLLDFYADRVYRQSAAIKPASLVPAYRVPPLVIRFIDQELLQQTLANPRSALDTADELWQQKNIESRLFAAKTLGRLPEQFEPLVLKRLTTWAEASDDSISLGLLLEHGTYSIRKANPMVWLKQIEKWAHSDLTKTQILAVKALQAFAGESGFDNLPPVYRLLTPLVKQADLRLQPSLEDILKTLAQRSPGETVFFLRQVMAAADNPAVFRLVRKIIPGFDPYYQEGLKTAVKDFSGRVENDNFTA